MRIAAQRGEPVSEVKRSYPERDFRQLAAYYRHSPPLEDRIDFWSAQIIAAQINPWRKKGSAAVKPASLIPNWWGDATSFGNQPKSVGEWKNLLIGLTKAKKGKIVYLKKKVPPDGGPDGRQPGDHHQRERGSADR